MEADSAVCQMTRSTTNTMFWNIVAADYYYKCTTNETCGSAILVQNPLPKDVQTDTLKSDWTAPVLDNDAYAPFCTPYTAAEIAADSYLSQFACKSISCVYQRPLVTKDTQDFQFSKVNGAKKTTDTMILPRMRSNVSTGFTSSTPNVVFGAQKADISIKINASCYNAFAT